MSKALNLAGHRDKAKHREIIMRRAKPGSDVATGMVNSLDRRSLATMIRTRFSGQSKPVAYHSFIQTHCLPFKNQCLPFKMDPVVMSHLTVRVRSQKLSSILPTILMSLAVLGLPCRQVQSADGVAPVQGAPGQGAPGQGALDEITEFKGTLKGFQPGSGLISITRDDGTEVVVSPPNNIANFQFRATATVPFLQRGMLIRFSGTFNQAGIATEPINKVTLFQPVAVKGLAGHQRENFVPGIYSANRKAPQQPVAVAKYNIVGNLMGISGGMMMVQAGKQAMRVPLAQDTELAVQFNNLNLAQPGDPVAVSGFYLPPDDTKVKAERITITTDRVYPVVTEKKPMERKRRSRRDKDEAEAAEEAKPAGGEEAGAKAEGN